jgi:hypothetical protein
MINFKTEKGKRQALEKPSVEKLHSDEKCRNFFPEQLGKRSVCPCS